MSRFFIFLLVISCQYFAQQIVTVKYSKPFAILKFLETAKGSYSISKTYKHQIDTSYLATDKVFKNLVKEYATINLDYTYQKNQFPEKRKHITSTWDLICIASITSNNNDEFFVKIIGLLPNSDYLKLKNLFTIAEGFYNRFSFNNYNNLTINKVNELQALSPKLNDLFKKFTTFYGSSWDKNIPFNLAIYPIYGNRGQTTATPHANSLEMGFLTQDDDNFGLLSVGMHEMCHVLYDEQPMQTQEMIDDAFSDSLSIYSRFAYHYIDEALATALGNGFAYNYLTTELDSSEWYNDNYINAYAKALYPMVKNYLDSSKQIDRQFIHNAVSVFRKTFPNAIYTYEPLLINTDVYFDTENELEINELKGYLHNAFRIYSSNTIYPLLDNNNFSFIKTSTETQLIFVYKNNSKVLLKLQQQFAKLKTLPLTKKNTVVSLIDKNNRAVIIVFAQSLHQCKEAVKLLKTEKTFTPQKWWCEF